MPKSPTRPTQYPSPQWARELQRGKPRHSCRGGRPRALEAVHSVHHVVQGGVQELLRSFGIQATDEFGGILEIGKEHRHLLAFAFQAVADSEDLFGKIRWGVGRRYVVLGACWHWGREGHGASVPGPDQ